MKLKTSLKINKLNQEDLKKTRHNRLKIIMSPETNKLNEQAF